MAGPDRSKKHRDTPFKVMDKLGSKAASPEVRYLQRRRGKLATCVAACSLLDACVSTPLDTTALKVEIETVKRGLSKEKLETANGTVTALSYCPQLVLEFCDIVPGVPPGPAKVPLSAPCPGAGAVEQPVSETAPVGAANVSVSAPCPGAGAVEQPVSEAATI